MPIQKRAPAAAANRAAAPAPINNRAAQRSTDVPAGGNFMSLNPEDMTQGGLLDDMDVEFTSVRFVEWDYNGSIDKPVLALLVQMGYEDQGKQASADQYYSAGDLSRFVPSEDGSHAVAVGGAKGMAESTNCAALIKSVLDQGFPLAKFGDGDVSAMEGLKAHINRVPQVKRGGRVNDKNNAGYELTVAVVTKIIQMPWEQSTGAAATRPTTAASAAKGRGASAKTQSPSKPEQAGQAGNADADEDALTAQAAEILIGVLENKGGSVAKSGIAPGSFQLLKGNADRTAILQLLTSNDWLENNAENFGWAFDGKTVSQAQ